MSIYKLGNTNFKSFSNKIDQSYFISSYYILTGDSIFIKYENPVFLNDEPVDRGILDNQLFYKLDYYITNFGDGQTYVSSPDENVYHKYASVGTYNITYSAVYIKINDNASSIKNIQEYFFDKPITVKSNWESYNQKSVRLNNEILLNLPYSLEEVRIQPNEWGVDDVFNTSITRLYECLEYLITKTQTINTYSPTLYYGWLGNYAGTASSKINWVTTTFNSVYLNKPELAKSSGESFFTNLNDSINHNNILYVLDNSELKIFKNTSFPEEIKFTNGDQISAFLINPISMDIDSTGTLIYIVDQAVNNLYKLNVSIDDKIIKNSHINIQLMVGGFGGMLNNYNFNVPTKVVYKNENVYVLDYNNYCIKQYDKNLNWLHTYTIDQFSNDRPVSINVLNNGLLYVLTKNYNIYIFDNLSNELFESFSVSYINDDTELTDIAFDKNENFLLILTKKNLFKFSLVGEYVNTFSIIKTDDVQFNNIKTGDNGEILLTTKNSIIKFQDILEVYKLGGGLNYSYWDINQLTVSKREFATDLVYNKSLVRMTQNIKQFRDTLNAKFVIANEPFQSGTVTYFSYIPIQVSDPNQKLIFSDDIENENVGVAVNELHTAPVLNKEIEKIYYALLELTDYLSIKNYNIKNRDCLENFCWSWKGMSCFNLSLPLIKTCNVNPITYNEINLSQQGLIDYAPTFTWGEAFSRCCK